jgi:hypothetical protein
MFTIHLKKKQLYFQSIAKKQKKKESLIIKLIIKKKFIIVLFLKIKIIKKNENKNYKKTYRDEESRTNKIIARPIWFPV